MRSRSPLHRTAAALAAAALAAGMAGCGGSDDDGGGGSGGSSYVSTWNEVCTSLTTAQTTFQKDAVKAQGSVTSRSEAALAKAVAGPASAAAGSFKALLTKVEGLEAPDEFADFQAKVDKSAPVNAKVFGALEEPLATGDIEAFQRVVRRLDPSGVFPALPAELKKQAAACAPY